jgi:carbon monoxide dehydrogenase subunit G
MELTGDIVIGAPRAAVWAALDDPEVLVRCIPGCESMEVLGPTERSASIKVKVGPVRARFAGRVRMSEVRPGEGCALSFEGSGGTAGMAKGVSRIELRDEGEATRLHYTVQASVGGKLGQVGGRMIDGAAKQMADQFFAALGAHLAPAAEVVLPAPTEPAAEAPSAAPARIPTVAPDQAPSAVADQVPPTAPAAVPRVVRAPQAQAPTATGEGVRVLWFVLGALSTGFGVWIASLLRSSP